MRLLDEPQGRRRIVSARIGLEIRPEIRRYIDHVNIRRLLFLPLLQNRVETRARRTYVIEDLGDFDLPLRRIEWLTAVDGHVIDTGDDILGRGAGARRGFFGHLHWRLDRCRLRSFRSGRFGCCAFGSRSEEHTSELPSLMRTSYAVF